MNPIYDLQIACAVSFYTSAARSVDVFYYLCVFYSPPYSTVCSFLENSVFFKPIRNALVVNYVHLPFSVKNECFAIELSMSFMTYMSE